MTMREKGGEGGGQGRKREEFYRLTLNVYKAPLVEHSDTVELLRRMCLLCMTNIFVSHFK